MSNRRKKGKQVAQPKPKSQAATRRINGPWYKRYWIIISGICAVLAAILLNGPQALRNSRTLPSEVSQTISTFYSWVKEDSEWTGKWTAHPEGFADLADMQLSNVDLEIVIWATEGRIDGTIATRRLCKELPMVNYILLEGSVFGDRASVTAWDLIGGHRVEFAQLTLSRDGYQMTIVPTSGNKEWFPPFARIARDPSAPAEKEELDSDHTFCAAERDAFLKSTLRPSGNG